MAATIYQKSIHESRRAKKFLASLQEDHIKVVELLLSSIRYSCRAKSQQRITNDRPLTLPKTGELKHKLENSSPRLLVSPAESQDSQRVIRVISQDFSTKIEIQKFYCYIALKYTRCGIKP